MKTECAKRHGYTMLYTVHEAGVDFDTQDDLVAIKIPKECRLQAGYRLWMVEAAISKHIKPCFYYLVSPNSAGAVNKFWTAAPWISYIRSVKNLSDSEAESILHNPVKYVLW